jgi:hypothetical protein
MHDCGSAAEAHARLAATEEVEYLLPSSHPVVTQGSHPGVSQVYGTWTDLEHSFVLLQSESISCNYVGQQAPLRYKAPFLCFFSSWL